MATWPRGHVAKPVTWSPGHSLERGFSLGEVLLVVVILGILASLGIPGYRKTVERGYFREAQDLLLTIYYGEQAHFSANKTYFAPPTSADWRTIFMEDPNIGSIPVDFTVPTASETTFTAEATRNGGPCGGLKLTVTASRREPTGSWASCPAL